MLSRRAAVQLSLCALVAILPVGRAAAASVEGMVRDRGGRLPGLSGAQVQLRKPNGQLTSAEVTDADGRYIITSVADGQYTLVVTMPGFIPRPHDRQTLRVRGKTTAQDVFLMKETGSQAYYGIVADGIFKKAAMAGAAERPAILAAEWNDLQLIKLPPSSKVILAKELNTRDASAKESVKGIRFYVGANQKDVEKTQAIFGQALREDRGLPARNAFKGMTVNDGVVADVFLFELKGASYSKAKEAVVVGDFLDKWSDTAASREFQDLQKIEPAAK